MIRAGLGITNDDFTAGSSSVAGGRRLSQGHTQNTNDDMGQSWRQLSDGPFRSFVNGREYIRHLRATRFWC